MNRYLLDTNVFIEARNTYYGMDFCPAFWDWLVAANRKCQVYSIAAIYDELTPNTTDEEDELRQWVKGAGKKLFLAHDAEMAASLSRVATWANSQGTRYHTVAVNGFLACGDYFLVTYALAHGDTVVTCEKKENSPKRIKIPDACEELGVRCIKPHTMLREAGARFYRRHDPDELNPEPY